MFILPIHRRYHSLNRDLEFPDCPGRLVTSTMRSWANLLVSTAKRRVKQLGVNLDTPRLGGLLVQHQIPFFTGWSNQACP